MDRKRNEIVAVGAQKLRTKCKRRCMRLDDKKSVVDTHLLLEYSIDTDLRQNVSACENWACVSHVPNF